MPQKEHRAPVRYALLPEEQRAIADGMKKQGKVTVGQIKRQAKFYRCALKPIYHIAEKVGVPVIPDQKPNRKKQVQTAAEKLFKTPTPEPTAEPEVPAEPKSLSETEFETAVQLLAEEEDRLGALDESHRREWDKREADFAEEVRAIEARLAEEEERARNAIRQTVALRKETRDDRDRLEELSSEVHSAQREQARLRKRAEAAEEITKRHKDELKASMARERLLLEALAQSEADLKAARAKLGRNK